MTGGDLVGFLLWRAYRAASRWWRQTKRLALASGVCVPDSRSAFGLRPADVPPRPRDDEDNIETLLLR